MQFTVRYARLLSDAGMLNPCVSRQCCYLVQGTTVRHTSTYLATMLHSSLCVHKLFSVGIASAIQSGASSSLVSG